MEFNGTFSRKVPKKADVRNANAAPGTYLGIVWGGQFLSGPGTFAACWQLEDQNLCNPTFEGGTHGQDQNSSGAGPRRGTAVCSSTELERAEKKADQRLQDEADRPDDETVEPDDLPNFDAMREAAREHSDAYIVKSDLEDVDQREATPGTREQK